MRTIAALLAALLLAGCAGRAFVRPDSNALVLGSTTYDQVIKPGSLL
jgi:hypothetical protein